MGQDTSNRIEYIDALRGMTMILVVYHHIAFWCLDNIEFGYNEFFIKFRMPTFFFISGWLFYKADRIWNKDLISSIIKKKFMVQIIPSLFFMLLYMYFFNEPEYKTPFDSKYGYWFTLALFEFIVIYIGIEVLFNKEQSNKKEIGVMLFLLFFSFIAFYYEYVRFDYNLGIFRKLLTLLSFSKSKYIFFFWLGTYVRKNFTTFIRLTDSEYMMAVCIIVYIICVITHNYSTNIEFVFISRMLSGISGIIIVFTYFRKYEVHFSKSKRIGKALQYIGRRTLDIYLLHYFILPYHMLYISTWLSEHSSKTIDMLIILIVSMWIISISLLLSNIIRLSPFLGHYLFGAKRATSSNKTDI